MRPQIEEVSQPPGYSAADESREPHDHEIGIGRVVVMIAASVECSAAYLQGACPPLASQRIQLFIDPGHDCAVSALPLLASCVDEECLKEILV